jgi:hypothetical protein
MPPEKVKKSLQPSTRPLSQAKETPQQSRMPLEGTVPGTPGQKIVPR